jgi:sugar phosphate isomerase/epimerase
MKQTRREFLQSSGALGAAVFSGRFLTGCTGARRIRVNGHLWIYASNFPPDWDSTPVLEQVFSDFKYAGIEGVEVMEVNLRHENAVTNMRALMEKYELPVTGTSYYADMWDRSKHEDIIKDVEMVADRLHQLGGKNIGLTVGDAGRKKTEEELDAQGEVLKAIINICNGKDILPNMHNHTFEVVDNLHDLKGTVSRVPELKLGPDLNWLVRGGVDPVEFIRTYGDKIVYMHIRDQHRDGKWTEYVGEGVTDFPAIAEAIKEIGFTGEVAIELASDIPPENAMRENWKRSREYVRKVFGW